MANDWIVPSDTPPPDKTPVAAKGEGDWIMPPEPEDVTAGMALRGVPVLGAYIPQAEAAIRAAAQPLTGVGEKGETFSERYAANLPKRQAQYEMAEENQPIASGVLKAGGATAALAPLGATAIGGRLLGATGPMAARIPLGAASGAGIGAADALARGEDVAKAGAIGMVGGAVAPVAGQAIGAAAQGVRSWLPGAPSAAERLAGQMGRAGMAADDLTPAALGRRAAELGPQGTASEFGENLRGLAQGMATQPGPARQHIFERMTQRAAGARQRIEDSITGALGPRQDMALLTRGEQAARATEADPLYEAFRSTRVHPTDQIKNLVPVLERDGLLADAQRMMALEGQPAQVNFFVTGDRKTWPTTEAFDYVKQAIDGRIGTAMRSGDRNMARIYTGVKQRLDDAVANSNPEAAQVWRQAREAWGNRTEILNAREAGQDAFKKGTRRDEMRIALQGMSNPERAAFREGARDALAEMMDASVRGDTNARQALLAPANREKLMMLGRNQASANLIRDLERELGFTDTLQRLIGNSQTASRQAMGAVTQPPAGGGAVRQYLQQLDLGRPASWVPTRAGFDAAQTLQTGRQAARYERAREILARSLMDQGAAGEQSLLRLQNTRAPGRVDPLASRIGTIGAQGIVGSRQHGGPVEEDRPYLVGEAGPETFVPDDPWARAAARTGHRGRAEGAGTRFVEGGYGIPAAYRALDKGAQEAFESGGKLQHYGNEYYDPAPVVQQAIGATAAPLVGPAQAGAVLGAGAVRRPELWHGVSKVKLPHPISEMTATHVPTGQINESVISPEAMQGGWLLPAWGDRSRTGSMLTAVGDRQLRNPVEMQGGHGFMPANVEAGAAWASGKPVIGRLANQTRQLAASGEPVYFPYTAMGERSVDFSHHVSDTLAEMVKAKPLPREAATKFDEMMRTKDANFPALPGWPGLRSPNLKTWLSKASGDARNKFAKKMDTAEAQELGLPSVAEARTAVTDPRLLDVPTGAAGQSIARLDPEGRVITEAATPHRTYDTQLGGQYVGGLGQSVPKEIMYPQMLDAYRQMGYDPFRYDYLMQRGVRGAPIAQRADQQWVDSISQYLEQARRQGQ